MSFEGKLLLVMQTVGIPLLLAVVLAVAGRSARWVVRVFALAALVLLIAGLGLHQRLEVGSFRDLQQTVLGLSLGLWWQLLYIAGGAAFYVAALAGALQTARGRRWGWFAGLVVSTLLANVAAVALATPLRVLNLINSLFQLVAQGGQDFYPHFYLVVSIVIAAAPLMSLLYHAGARGPLPSGMGMNDPLPVGNPCARVHLFAWAMNPGLVAARPVHVHNLARVRGVPLDNLPAGKTCAVTVDASTHRGHPLLRQRTPRSSRGHRACSSFAGWPETRSPRR